MMKDLWERESERPSRQAAPKPRHRSEVILDPAAPRKGLAGYNHVTSPERNSRTPPQAAESQWLVTLQ